MKPWEFVLGGLVLIGLVYFIDPYFLKRRRKVKKLSHSITNLNLGGFDAADPNKDPS